MVGGLKRVEHVIKIGFLNHDVSVVIDDYAMYCMSVLLRRTVSLFGTGNIAS